MPEASVAVTYYGHVGSTQDALILIEACLRGHLNHTSRRPRSSELTPLANSGNIFVYESRSSGITSWRDGLQWSQAEKTGNFELSRQLASSSGRGRMNGTYSSTGLCRRTISVVYRGIRHNLVAYFSLRDLANNNLRAPSTDPGLAGVAPRLELWDQSFSAPVDQDDWSEIIRIAGI